MRSIYFHEDDYLQLELLPLAAKSFCLEEMDYIESFAREHQAGAGYSDAFQRTEAPCATKDLGLRREQLDAALDFLPAFDRVETGYGACREECRTTYARGPGTDLAVFWEQDEDGHVKNIWLELCIDFGQTELACRVLTALGTAAPLVLADWNRCVCVNLASAREIERYIAAKAWARKEISAMYFKDWEELSKLCPLESGIWNKEKLYEYLVQSCYHLSDHIDAFMEKYQKDEALAGLLFDFLLDDYYDGSDSQMGAAKYIARLDRELLKKNRESLLKAQENEVAWKRPFHNGEDWRSFIDSDSEY